MLLLNDLKFGVFWHSCEAGLGDYTAEARRRPNKRVPD
jgi:hypothetical protein